ncbi:YIP1 family protein [Caldicellulosiruptor danielii]|uniref:YIP1 family protein n=2 Tax=Anaerocellum danielii TaxID=1387557 RepID=A0ABZ0U2R6_9FIRM|nr:YIP1 family protein [Caldicellulosiruptor danielii]WPX09018.1 YIP1 family protein [Caldicellulosiruptor danielii]
MNIRMTRKRVVVLVTTLLLILNAPLFGFANMIEVPYYQYNYDIYNWDIPSAAGYYPAEVLSGKDLGVGNFSSPRDMFVDDNNNIYILDAGNDRIVVFDKDFNFKKQIDKFTQNGQKVKMVDPSGISIDKNGLIYVADKGAKCVFVVNQDGQIISKITKPKSDLVAANKDFVPIKVAVDNAGVVYVLSLGSYEGALMFDSKNNFLGFFGSNKVVVTLQLLIDRIWKKILSKEQSSSMVRYLPTELASIDIGDDGFIYTCSNYASVSVGELKKLNFLGKNILWYKKKDQTRDFGDLPKYYGKRLEDSYFVDINVTKDGFINALDYERGRVFQYDQNANLLFIMGGKADQMGTFRDPVAVESIGNTILVLDQQKATITVFKETKFGELVHKATVLYNDGKYDEAKQLWEQVNKMDCNYALAHVGLGKALLRMNRYSDALKHFRLANDKEGFSEAKEQLRNDFLKRNFGIIATGLIALIILIVVLRRRFKKQKSVDEEYTRKVSKEKFPIYTMFHPFKGFEELKDEKKGSVLIATIIVLLYFIVAIIHRQYTGFIFNPYRQDRINVISIFSSTVVMFFFWVLSNWSVSTLTEGEGTFQEIWIFSAYALLPYIICNLIYVILSNIFIMEEGMFLTFINIIGMSWLIICMLNAIKAVHQFSFGKTVATVVASLIGIAVIIFIMILVFTLFAQLFGFIQSIYNELILRM